MNEFLSVAKSLEIKEISKDVDCDNEQLNDKINEELPPLKDQNLYETETHDNPENVVANIRHAENKTAGYKNESGQYSCNECDKQYRNDGSLSKHFRSVHRGIKYPCNQCNKVCSR